MSLIPSESLNFPDSFRANVGWRLDQDDQEGAAPPHESGAAGNPFPQPVGVPKEVAEPAIPPPSTPAEPAPLPTSEVDPSPPSVAPQGEAHDQQLELIPKRAEEKAAENSPGEVEMNALLKYFQGAGAVPPAVSDQPNGKTPLPENVATVAGVVPTNVAVDPPRISIAPNEPPIIERAKVEPSTPQPSEPKTESKIVGNAPASQQSIVAALESLAHTDVEAPIGSVDVQTPAQANHILGLIAAAVQRGALIGETVMEPRAEETAAAAAAPSPAVAAPSPAVAAPPPVAAAPPPVVIPPATPLPLPVAGSGFSIKRDPVDELPAVPIARAPKPIFSIPPRSLPEKPAPSPPVVSEPITGKADALVDSVPASLASSAAPDIQTETPETADVPKAPAKIRITPRKIKPRPQAQPTSDDRPASPSGHDFPTDVPAEEKVIPVLERKLELPVEPETKPSPKSLESSEAAMPRPELSARKIAAARLELAQGDLFMFSNRERRNRWLGFGLSELAVVTALLLLGRYGFTHHFPDPTLKVLVFILIFAAAAVAIALPIAFFRNDPQRWGRVGR